MGATEQSRWMPWVMGAALVLLPSLSVWAQESGQGETRRNQLESMAQSDGTLSEDVGALSSDQKLQKAQKTVNKNKEALSSVESRLETARQGEQDVAKINCISEKVAAIKGFLKVSEQSYVELKSAIEEGDTESANHHYTLIAISGQKVGNLQQQSKACIGQVERYAEGTEVNVDVDDSLETDLGYLTDDPEAIDTGGPEMERLPELTPFQ